jgi:hypothetical protein
MLFLSPADLRALDWRGLEELLGRTELTVAFGDGEIRGIAAAALLFADYAVVDAETVLVVDTAPAWAGAAWRLGARTLAWYACGAQAGEIVDEVTRAQPEQWADEWMRHRSVHALDAAALLIRSRGGDVLERAEFARLFAIGEPQTGLGAFLAKVRPSYSRNPEKP